MFGLKIPENSEQKRHTKISMLTSSNSKNEIGNHERRSAMTSLENARKSSKYDDNVSNTTNKDTKADGLVSSKASICNPSTEDRDNVGQESEEQRERIGELQAPAQSTCGFLRAFGGSSSSVSSDWERELHEVRPDLDNAIVGSTFCKLHGAEDEGGRWNLVRYLSERAAFLLRWPRIVDIVLSLPVVLDRIVAIVDLEFFVVYRIAKLFDRSERATTMGLSNLGRNAGREHGRVSGVVMSCNAVLVSKLYLGDKGTNPS